MSDLTRPGVSELADRLSNFIELKTSLEDLEALKKYNVQSGSKVVNYPASQPP